MMLPDEMKGRPLVLSLSGGKDSGATALHLRELGLEFSCVFADTAWEAPETYQYLDEVLEPLFGPIARVCCDYRGATGMQELVIKKAMFPARQNRFCTSELKFHPISKHLAGFDDPINVTGIRREESRERAELDEWEEDSELGTGWRPLINWTEQDVIDIHRRNGLDPNPLYLAGATRVGCWPCIYSRKAEVRLVADRDPDRIRLIAEIERQLTGDGSKGPRTMFHGRGNWGKGGPVAIGDVVRWSRTSRGGRQFELLDSGAPGCARWGLCEGGQHVAG